MSISVVPENPRGADALAARIQTAVDTVNVTSPEDAIVKPGRVWPSLTRFSLAAP